MKAIVIASCLALVACSEPLTAKSVASATSVCLDHGGLQTIEYYRSSCQNSMECTQYYKAYCNNGMLIYNKETN